MKIGQRSIMVTQPFKGISGPLSHMSAHFYGHNGAKIFKIGQKLTEKCPKKDILKIHMYVLFNSNMVVKKSKIFFKLSPQGMS